MACVGGFVTGIVSVAAIKNIARRKAEPKIVIQKQYGDLMFTEAEYREKDVTTFSDITALVGSVSDKELTGGISPREYPHVDILHNYPNTTDNQTLMAKYLSPEIYEAYWNVETAYGFTFDNAIQVGLDISQFPNCGFIAGDEETFDVFPQFIDPVITEKHHGFRRDVHRHLKCLDPTKLSRKLSQPMDNKYVQSISYTAGRSVSGYRFLPTCNRAERRELEEKFRNVFENVSTANGGVFEGEYYPIDKQNRDILNRLPHGTPFYWAEKPSTPIYDSAGVTRDWPDARGIFVTRCGSIFISVNRDDHLRIFLRETHADVLKVFQKFCTLHKVIEDKMEEEGLKFAYHRSYGFLHWYPSVIGTGLKVCVRIRLQNLSGSPMLFEVMRRLRLRFNFCSKQEKVPSEVMEIYNGDRLGFSEVQLTELVISGANKLIELEQQLEKGLPIEGMIPVQKGTPMTANKAQLSQC